MKKFLGIILALVLAVTCFASDAVAGVSVELDGELLTFEQPPVIIEERTLVPLRAIFEALGASVEWDGDTKTVTSTKGDVTIKLTIGSNLLYKNDETVELDVPAQIVGEGYTMVPARAIAESFGVTVDWNGETKTVILTSPVVEEAPATVEGAIVNLLDADKYDGDAKFYASGTAEKALKVVDDPKGEKGKVFFLESNVTEKNSWTYFWATDVGFKNNQRYIVEFDIMLHDKDSHGDTATKSSIGICYQYFDTVAGKNKDHGMGQVTVKAEDGWVHITLIKPINPEEPMDEAQKSAFGIFASPVDAHCYSYYLDNLSVLPYDGDMGDGLHDSAAIEAAKKLAAFDIDAVEGIVYDFEAEDDFLGFAPGKQYAPTVANGALNMTCTETSGVDVQFGQDVDFAAADYNKVAVKVKCDNDEEFFKSFVSAYFTTDSEEKLSQDKSCQSAINGAKKLDDGYYVVILDMGSNAKWNGQIKHLRIDPMQGPFATVSVDKVVVYKD